MKQHKSVETKRLLEEEARQVNWKRWGPYLSERQWATVREDYSEDGEAWRYFPHDHARSRAYRWGEDGLLGICDRQCRLCFALALWNEKDPFLKERLFGLTGPEGNHGEDVKEEYFYVDATPTHSYMKALYKYPQGEFPYSLLVEENRRRDRNEPEYELTDTGIFADNRYFDVVAEYAKNAPDDVLIRISVHNRGPEPATLHVLPTLWFRNTWSWGCKHEGCAIKPRITLEAPDLLTTNHESLERYALRVGPGQDGIMPPILFTENETNMERLFAVPNGSRYVKDGFHAYVTQGDLEAVNPQARGTKAAPYYVLHLPSGASQQLRLRLALSSDGAPEVAPRQFDAIMALRKKETDAFYTAVLPPNASEEGKMIVRQVYAGLLWTKQFYHYIVQNWLEGDPEMLAPPESRLRGRNAEWAAHLYNRDVISMPDKWEYPWYAAWDLAFHMVPFARIDPAFAKAQLLLFLREWYMHPNGQLPAYEFALGDVNPPVHAWAVWRIYALSKETGQPDRTFLERAFQKLLLNFTWWVNRKDSEGRNLFSGGFLGLDNIGVFDRSKPLPEGGALQQADGTAWMGFYCLNMLVIALELADAPDGPHPAYADMASKFFEHFIQICDAMNALGGSGLWDEEDGFYYDQIQTLGQTPIRLKLRSMVGLLPLIAVAILQKETLNRLPGFKKRFEWFLTNRGDLARHITWTEAGCAADVDAWLLALPSKDRLIRVLEYLFDESEFLSPFGIRSLSKFHDSHPYLFRQGGQEFQVRYTPGESDTGLFGGNSNWRGPIWFPVNMLLIEALQTYHEFYGADFKVACPTGSENYVTLREAADIITARLTSLFFRNAEGIRPYQGANHSYREDVNHNELLLFHEYFHADTGQGLGASHQTGWTALIATLIK